MANIGWDETAPQDSESAGLGDDRIRSLKTSLRQGLDAEHVWPSAGGDAGVHRLGSARAYVGTQSQVSSSGTDGRIMWVSDTSRLFHVGSDGTNYIGGMRGISAGAIPGSIPQRAIWVEEFGQAVTGSGGSVTVTIPNSGYSNPPFVFISGYTTVTGGGRFPAWGANDVTAATFTVWAFDATFSLFQAQVPFYWRSIGTKIL